MEQDSNKVASSESQPSSSMALTTDGTPIQNRFFKSNGKCYYAGEDSTFVTNWLEGIT